MSKKSRGFILGISCAIFLGLGVLTAGVGPLVGELAQRNSCSLATIGSIYTAIFLGALCSQVIAGPLSDRVGQKPVLIGSSLLLGAGMLGVGISKSLTLTLCIALIAGLGHGAVDLATNVLIARVYSQRNVSALNLLNLFFGIGAFVGPILVSVALGLWQSGIPALWFGVALLWSATIWLLRTKISLEPVKNVEKGTAVSIYGSPLLWILGLLALIYVGTENGMGAWTTTFMEQTTAMSTAQASLVTSGFWLALTGGRLFSAAIATRLQATKVLMLSLLQAMVGAILFTASQGQSVMSTVGVILIGFGFGSVYPTMVAIITTTFTSGPGKAVSVVASMGSIGGMLLPWFQGVLLERSGTSAAAIFVAITTLLMLLLFIFTTRFINRSGHQTAEASVRLPVE